MTFTESIQTCIRKCTTTEGRASRSEFWWFYLFIVIVNMVTAAIFLLIGSAIGGLTGSFAALDVFSKFAGIANVVLMLAVMVRRLHDTGHSGLWYFIVLIPLVGWIWFLILLLMSSNEENQYGLPEY